MATVALETGDRRCVSEFQKYLGSGLGLAVPGKEDFSHRLSTLPSFTIDGAVITRTVRDRIT